MYYLNISFGGVENETYSKFFKGIVVGIATLVPGVSGGTMAIVLGIYDDLIHAVASFFKDIKKHTIFLFEVGLGALLALLLFSRLLENVIEKYPEIMGFLFIGIICGGLPVLYKKATEQKRLEGFYFLNIRIYNCFNYVWRF